MGIKRYLIVGDGVAGARAGVKIREADQKGEIHIFTEEAYPFYYRVRFPELVAGEVTIQNITIHTQEWYQNRGISLHLEEAISEVYPEKKRGHQQERDDLFL